MFSVKLLYRTNYPHPPKPTPNLTLTPQRPSPFVKLRGVKLRLLFFFLAKCHTKTECHSHRKPSIPAVSIEITHAWAPNHYLMHRGNSIRGKKRLDVMSFYVVKQTLKQDKRFHILLLSITSYSEHCPHFEKSILYTMDVFNVSVPQDKTGWSFL